MGKIINVLEPPSTACNGDNFYKFWTHMKNDDFQITKVKEHTKKFQPRKEAVEVATNYFKLTEIYEEL